MSIIDYHKLFYISPKSQRHYNFFQLGRNEVTWFLHVAFLICVYSQLQCTVHVHVLFMSNIAIKISG